MKHQPPHVREGFAQCFVGDVVTSAVPLTELEYGVACCGDARAHNQAQLDRLLEDIPVAPFEALTARAYGPLRATSRERNKYALGKLVAAHAASLGVTLVTNNEADSQGFAGPVIENWVSNH